jgi:hypothetical protein
LSIDWLSKGPLTFLNDFILYFGRAQVGQQFGILANAPNNPALAILLRCTAYISEVGQADEKEVPKEGVESDHPSITSIFNKAWYTTINDYRCRPLESLPIYNP